MLYVHDDQIGPYSRVTNASSVAVFSKWVNEWVKEPRLGPFPGATWDEVILNDLILPLYPKIRLSYREVYHNCVLLRNRYKNFEFHVCLSDNHDYKGLLIKSNIKDKLKVLKSSLPRFVWVINTQQDGNNKLDFVIDATSHKFRIIKKIYYN